MAAAEAVVGVRVRDRYRHRRGTLVAVRWEPHAWPELGVRWDDDPAYVKRVVHYGLCRAAEEENPRWHATSIR